MMKTIDFKALLDERGIEYTTRQHSTGNIGVNCPFCAQEGDPDPSHHLGIHLETGKWSCWRNPTHHKGVKPHRLLRALLGMRHAEVDALIGIRPDVVDEFESIFAPGVDPFGMRLRQEYDRLTRTEEIKNFVSLSSGLAHRHRLYLTDRGIDCAFASAFGVLAGVVGYWASRVIVPLFVDGYMLSWVGRKVVRPQTDFDGPKYLTLKGVNLKDYLWQYDRIEQVTSGNLIVTEGVFDALQLQQYVRNSIVTCLYGREASEEQIAILHSAKKRFDRLIIMLDSDSDMQSERIAHQIDAEIIRPLDTFGVHDPGALTKDHAPVVQKLML